MEQSKSTQNQLVVVTVTGVDKPGVTSALTDVLSASMSRLVDIEQVVVHNQLILAFLIEFSPEEKNESVLKDLLFKAKEFGLDLDFNVLNGESAQQFESKKRYVITLLTSGTGAKAMSLVSHVAAKSRVNIESINRLSERDLKCVEIHVSPPADLKLSEFDPFMFQFKQNLFKEANAEPNVDIAFQPDNLFRRSKRLVVMDMDSTLIQGEVIDELAAKAGQSEKVKELTKKAMNGEIDFEESLKNRVACLEGLPESALQEVFQEIQLTDGAELLIKVLKRLGLKIAVISGGFSQITDPLKTKLGLDYAYANQLEISGGKLTGKVIAPIVTPQRKADLMDVISQQEKILLDQVIAIGDGANDLQMLERAGMGIAFQAKEKVRKQADQSINFRGLDSVLYLLGIKETEIASIS